MPSWSLSGGGARGQLGPAAHFSHRADDLAFPRADVLDQTVVDGISLRLAGSGQDAFEGHFGRIRDHFGVRKLLAVSASGGRHVRRETSIERPRAVVPPSEELRKKYEPLSPYHGRVFRDEATENECKQLTSDKKRL